MIKKIKCTLFIALALMSFSVSAQSTFFRACENVASDFCIILLNALGTPYRSWEWVRTATTAEEIGIISDNGGWEKMYSVNENGVQIKTKTPIYTATFTSNRGAYKGLPVTHLNPNQRSWKEPFAISSSRESLKRLVFRKCVTNLCESINKVHPATVHDAFQKHPASVQRFLSDFTNYDDFFGVGRKAFFDLMEHLQDKNISREKFISIYKDSFPIVLSCRAYYTKGKFFPILKYTVNKCHGKTGQMSPYKIKFVPKK